MMTRIIVKANKVTRIERADRIKSISLTRRCSQLLKRSALLGNGARAANINNNDSALMDKSGEMERMSGLIVVMSQHHHRSGFSQY